MLKQTMNSFEKDIKKEVKIAPGHPEATVTIMVTILPKSLCAQ